MEVNAFCIYSSHSSAHGSFSVLQSGMLESDKTVVALVVSFDNVKQFEIIGGFQI